MSHCIQTITSIYSGSVFLFFRVWRGGIALGNTELFNPLGGNERFRAGWHRENMAKVLISAGVGNDFLPLRLGATPEVHIITLRTPSVLPEEAAP